MSEELNNTYGYTIYNVKPFSNMKVIVLFGYG
jgi:hypothetical protein